MKTNKNDKKKSKSSSKKNNKNIVNVKKNNISEKIQWKEEKKEPRNIYENFE